MMSEPEVVHPSCCQQCDGSFEYRLDVAAGGGFRYDVVCSSCGYVYYGVSSPPLFAPFLAA